VKAVNLIPADQRRGGGGPGRSGGAVYAVLGALAIVVVAAVVYVVSVNAVTSKRDDLDRLRAQTEPRRHRPTRWRRTATSPRSSRRASRPSKRWPRADSTGSG
jgi:hypothetical protein